MFKQTEPPLINHSRYLPDRRDLNRVFPGNQTGALAARLAHRFLKEIVERSELGIDLHSAAIHRTNYPQVRISADDPGMEALAEVFGAPVIMKTPLRDGSLRGDAKKSASQFFFMRLVKDCGLTSFPSAPVSQGFCASCTTRA